MKLRAVLLCLFIAAIIVPVFAEGPGNLLGPENRWQPSGEWKVDTTAGTAEATAGEMLAELSSAQSVRLAGRWLSMRVALGGDSPKAGLWLAGLRDSQGKGVRFVIEGASASITNGRGKTLATLAADAMSKPLELTFVFTGEKVTINSRGKEVGTLEVKFTEPEATPSLFVERGQAVFSEVLLSKEAPAVAVAPPVPPVPPMPPAPATGPTAQTSLTPPELAVKPAAPAKPAPRALRPPAAPPVPRAPVAPPAAAIPPRPAGVPTGLVINFAAEKMTPLKSGWNEYFGVHGDLSAGPWKTVRQPDGPRFGRPSRDKHTGNVENFAGPFSGGKVQSSLADFRDWQRKESRGLDENLAQIIRDDRSAIFIAPWVSPFTLAQQDEVWALMKQVYGGNPGADGRVVFQWGDDINLRRLGVIDNARMNWSQPHGGAPGFRNVNVPEDALAYAEWYFAPAVEAVRRASKEIFHDERHIPVVIGSCALAGRAENRAWFMQVLDHELAGGSTPTLKGQRVSQLVDVLTVNYPFVSADGEFGLQELWDRYCAKPGGIKSLWVTEEYGAAARSAAVMLSRAARFLAWAAKNGLDAQQTRLVWNFPEEHRANDEAAELAAMLGKSFRADALRVGVQEVEGGKVMRIMAGETKLLFVFIPNTNRLVRRAASIGEVVLEVGAKQAGKPWVATPLQSTLHRAFADAGKTVIPLRREGSRLVLDVGATALGAWGVLVETP